MSKPLSEAARQKLLGVSTATLTTLLFKRGLRNTFVQRARPLNPRQQVHDQRVDDCKVPPQKRGTVRRPTDCAQ